MKKSYDVVCLSHLRWDFVYQRPQHLLNRIARERRVYFVEEPIFDDGQPRMDVSYRDADRVFVAVPHLPLGTSPAAAIELQHALLDALIQGRKLTEFALWYYTPMALPFSRHLRPVVTVYDCMDELSAFKGAPVGMQQLEVELLRRADVVFTGGHSLFEAKRHMHRNIHPFPSSVDREHFGKARLLQEDPSDQADIPHPRAGFFGVIDERMDIELLAGLADARPDLHIVMVGPVVKIDPASLPQRANLHWLGGKSYQELPSYIAGWDVALLPFARNESTRFISPTKTPEYLAAGRPVVSTSIQDVVRPYGEQCLARIADTARDFVVAIDAALAEDATQRLARADEMLALMSWDRTWGRMKKQLEACIVEHEHRLPRTVPAPQPAEEVVAK